MPICEKCKNSYSDKDNFCPQCGNANPNQSSATLIRTNVVREICFIDPMLKIVDKKIAEMWWQVVINDKIIAKTEVIRFEYSSYLFAKKVTNSLNKPEYFYHPLNMRIYYSEGLYHSLLGMSHIMYDLEENMRMDYRALVSMLMERGWEIAVRLENDVFEKGTIKAMQRVK